MKNLIRMLMMLSILGALALGSSAQDTEISLLQWSHFVPRYDEWFDAYAAEWGEANGIGVTVDHVNFTELFSTLAAEIDAGDGHSIVEVLFSPASFIDGLHDLRDINEAAAAAHGERASTCGAASYLPVNDTWYAYTHGYVPDPGDYDIALWTEVGYPEGPKTYDDLLEGGRAIYEATGIPVGIGMSPELDSRMANRAAIWSFGGSIQDENENVVLNSEETIAAVKYLAQLQNEAMTDEVFGWTAASNNQALIAGEVSYILNSNSAYRSLQKIDEAAAANIGFTPALEGPAGAYASSHVWQIYVIPKYVEGAELEAAKKFILDHTANYSDVTYHSELYNFPCYASTVPELDGWLEADPWGSEPPNKFEVLKTVNDWSVHLGFPGVTNPAISQVFAESIIPNMVAQVALGEMSAEDAVAQAQERIEEIFGEWRARGLVGGG
ncbi:MAG: ABC transporter substrate-binding protein [Chloroflexi bacterium]|nr:ABC transporter substrate-binding protein [Chloroflexota bacterium]MCY3716961.1 ABC transporter substrate-binding protein [Chloroflexota bacterium]MDE2650145.1 ABC transporter substrate-binding protein [Chloroflexota bacterium]MXV92859.1 carbohydrate ABC transporter substrate-binding protein [Chloroflexota bacterium]MXX51359.1 carbohydrate ABC transporter substrate-binding protein [Chloroflexota bacterium]